MNRVLFFLSGLMLLAMLACDHRKSPETQRVPKQDVSLQLIGITKPTNGQLFDLGDEIQISLKLKSDSISPDSIVLYVDNERVGELTSLEYSLATHSFSLGTRQLWVTGWRKGQRQTASVGVKLKSNIEPLKLSYRVVNTYPHDIEAYTQGLFYHNGYFIESTGQRGLSSLRRVDIKTGKVLQSVNLDTRYFGEGTTIYDGEIYQITWTSRKGFVYNPETFNLIRTFDYPTQGWGLTTMDNMLVMSDGSNVLYFLEPKSFTEIKRVEVFDNLGPVNQLNELELIKGKIYANIYLTNKIVVIDPTSGRVDAVVNFSELLSEKDKHKDIDVFNGIAWDSKGSRLFVTGKNWPKVFEVELN